MPDVIVVNRTSKAFYSTCRYCGCPFKEGELVLRLGGSHARKSSRLPRYAHQQCYESRFIDA
ncbi:MAG: hypothetical protein NWE99_05350 [Candidatus Bathyarchaeota archaeon]|nr:hypothetical protein [Candidatus Bathyarchaeota archaeon]